jgi:NAD(P)-dependent dehydrogenase (short-subunit alcohol dehydrogenase family)
MTNGSRKVVVTGAGRGAGWGIARVFGEAGDHVAVIDIDKDTAERTADEIGARGGSAFPVICDVADPEQVEAAFGQIGATFGSLDVLVNTVALIDTPSSVADMPFDNWQRAMRVNVDSVFLCSKFAIPLLRASGSGLIVNISSINGTRGFPFRAPYGASKAAVINLTETLAMELLDDGIRANCLVPGGIAGERVRILGELYAKAGLIPKSDSKDGGEEALVKGLKLVEPEEIGRYVQFLASPDGIHINGQALWIGMAPRMGAQAKF